MKRRFLSILLAALGGSLTAADWAPPTPGETLLLRFPATNGQVIVFSYAGDLYSVPVAGGEARRLTSHVGYEMFPRFSPDGQTLAFTAQYDGNTEVYTMPAGGGEPTRVTITPTLGRDDIGDRMGPNNIVVGWKNTTPEIVFRSRGQSWNDFVGHLLAVPMAGGLPSQVPVPRGGFASFSPDDQKMAYNRVFREFRTWKGYRGGMADDVWVYDFVTGGLTNITNHEAQDIIPMWAPDGRIFFLSDRDGRMNLFSYQPATKAMTQHTRYTGFDIKFPSLGGGLIVYEWAGRLHTFNLTTGASTTLRISLASDGAGARPARQDVSKAIAGASPSPDGARVAVSARGDVFTVPAQHGPTRLLSTGSNIHDRDPAWSPDGRWVAVVSDRSGETELWLLPQDGRGEPVQLTTGSDSYFYGAEWSPDSKYLAWSDRQFRLRVVEVATKTVSTVYQSNLWEPRDFAWSPDSQWLAYTRIEEEGANRIVLHRLSDSTTVVATDGWYASRSPSFSSDGKYLFFVSARDFTPTFSDIEFNFTYFDRERLYFVALAKDTPNLFAPRSDEVKVTATETPAEAPATTTPEATPAATPATTVAGAEAPKPAAAEAPKAREGAAKVVVTVDAEGLIDRIGVLPTPPARYSGATVTAERAYYLREASRGARAGPGARWRLYTFDFKERKETEVGEFGSFQLTADGKKLFVRQRDRWAVIDAPKGKAEVRDDQFLNFAQLATIVDRRAEWRQIYDESWRQMRDFFYAENLHGLDWPKVGEKYRALLPFVQHRNDLTYLIGELIGELNAGHAYVGGGDRPEAPRIPLGLLGAILAKDAATGYVKVVEVLPGDNWNSNRRSPLSELGVGVVAGDFLIAINGQDLASVANPYSLLIGTAGQQVALKVNGQPTAEGAREVTVVPIADESDLYYERWVRGNIAKVDAASGGRIGYVHIPNMGEEGLNEFVRHYYPQITKEALIVDARYNGGGFVSPLIIERLRREVAMWDYARGVKPKRSQPDPESFLGPMVLMLNEYSASDGDIVGLRWRQYGMGPIIGKRSWGGTVGIRGSLPFVDGGILNRPEFGGYTFDGTWAAEGTGVTPDIIVDNDPKREFEGGDDQLDRALAEVTALLTQNPPPNQPAPSLPVKPLP